MRSSRRTCCTLAVSLLCLLALGSAAYAAPITVNVRIEGATSTLYEGPVATEAISPPGLTTPSSSEAHPCDVAHNGSNGGFVPSGASATSAVRDAAAAHGLSFDAIWFSSLSDFEVTQVGPDRNGGEAEGFPSWGYAVNYTTANVGGCQFQLAPGSDVLWAYNYFNLAHLLNLSGPASASTGAPFTVHVADGQNGAPIAGAAIGTLSAGVTTKLAGNATTDASGNATISLPSAGAVTLKATQPESVRSNALSICVHAGNDGTCGTTANGASTASPPSVPVTRPAAATAVVARVVGLINGHVYTRRAAPRVLRGIAQVAPGGSLRQVRIRLQRRSGRKCFAFSGSRERFVRSRRCAPASFFSVGSAQSFSYLLPSRLPAGRYVYDIEAVEGSGRVTGPVGGVSHVIFRVK